jgi:ribosome-associated protein
MSSMTDRGTRRFRELAILAARAADDKKAEDIVVRSIASISLLAEYLLVASVNNPAQMEAVADKIRHDLKDHDAVLVHRDGSSSELWRILDYGGLLIHLMHPKARDFYSIDKLFHEARRVGWENGSH